MIKHRITIVIKLTMIFKFKTPKTDHKQYNMIIIEVQIHNKRPKDASLPISDPTPNLWNQWENKQKERMTTKRACRCKCLALSSPRNSTCVSDSQIVRPTRHTLQSSHNFWTPAHLTPSKLHLLENSHPNSEPLIAREWTEVILALRTLIRWRHSRGGRNKTLFKAQWSPHSQDPPRMIQILRNYRKRTSMQQILRLLRASLRHPRWKRAKLSHRNC